MACEICTWRISILKFDLTKAVFFSSDVQGYKYYYVPESGNDVPYPLPLDAEWKKKADDAGAKALIIQVTRSRPADSDVKGQG